MIHIRNKNAVCLGLMLLITATQPLKSTQVQQSWSPLQWTAVGLTAAALAVGVCCIWKQYNKRTHTKPPAGQSSPLFTLTSSTGSFGETIDSYTLSQLDGLDNIKPTLYETTLPLTGLQRKAGWIFHSIDSRANKLLEHRINILTQKHRESTKLKIEDLFYNKNSYNANNFVENNGMLLYARIITQMPVSADSVIGRPYDISRVFTDPQDTQSFEYTTHTVIEARHNKQKLDKIILTTEIFKPKICASAPPGNLGE